MSWSSVGVWAHDIYLMRIVVSSCPQHKQPVLKDGTALQILNRWADQKQKLETAGSILSFLQNDDTWWKSSKYCFFKSLCIIAVPLSHLSSLVLLILEREICISSRGASGISFLFCRQVRSFECSSSASWLAFIYFVCRLVMYPQNIAKVAVQYHVPLNFGNI